MAFFRNLVGWLLTLGPASVFLVCFIDGAGLPTGGGADLALILFSSKLGSNPQSQLLPLAATLGSTLGCLVLYYLGRRGGERLMIRQDPHRRSRIKARIAQRGTWAIFISMLAPPPYPAKLFVLGAGVFQMPVLPFALSVLAGRALRYWLLWYLTVRFGQRVFAQLQAYYLPVLILLGLTGLVLLWIRWRRPRIELQ
jgi:membrane protein YqaA with SNARE-associated domain